MAFITLKPEDKEKLQKLVAKIKGIFVKKGSDTHTSGTQTVTSQVQGQKQISFPKTGLTQAQQKQNGSLPMTAIKDFLLSPGPPENIFYYRLGIGAGVLLLGLVFLLLGLFLF